MVVLHTRWHESDLIGTLTQGEYKQDWVDYFDYLKGARAKWVRLSLPAVAEKDELYRKKGEALWPERYSLVELNDIKATLGPYEWGALYQGRPVDDANRKFKKEWFHYRTWADVEKMRVRKFATIDPNLRKSDESDYCGVARNYINERGEWHLRANRYRVDSSEVLNLIFMLHDEGFEKIGVEEGAFSYVVEPFLKEEMRKRGKFPNVKPLKHGGRMKETRIEGLVPWYNNAQVWHIVGECEELEEEMLVFPRGTHDDVVDAVAYQVGFAEKPVPITKTVYGQRKRTNIAV
jgi:phage terminase large subunit-like protein